MFKKIPGRKDESEHKKPSNPFLDPQNGLVVDQVLKDAPKPKNAIESLNTFLQMPSPAEQAGTGQVTALTANPLLEKPIRIKPLQSTEMTLEPLYLSVDQPSTAIETQRTDSLSTALEVPILAPLQPHGFQSFLPEAANPEAVNEVQPMAAYSNSTQFQELVTEPLLPFNAPVNTITEDISMSHFSGSTQSLETLPASPVESQPDNSPDMASHQAASAKAITASLFVKNPKNPVPVIDFGFGAPAASSEGIFPPFSQPTAAQTLFADLPLSLEPPALSATVAEAPVISSVENQPAGGQTPGFTFEQQSADLFPTHQPDPATISNSVESAVPTSMSTPAAEVPLMEDFNFQDIPDFSVDSLSLPSFSEPSFEELFTDASGFSGMDSETLQHPVVEPVLDLSHAQEVPFDLDFNFNKPLPEIAELTAPVSMYPELFKADALGNVTSCDTQTATSETFEQSFATMHSPAPQHAEALAFTVQNSVSGTSPFSTQNADTDMLKALDVISKPADSSYKQGDEELMPKHLPYNPDPNLPPSQAISSEDDFWGLQAPGFEDDFDASFEAIYEASAHSEEAKVVHAPLSEALDGSIPPEGLPLPVSANLAAPADPLHFEGFLPSQNPLSLLEPSFPQKVEASSVQPVSEFEQPPAFGVNPSEAQLALGMPQETFLTQFLHAKAEALPPEGNGTVQQIFYPEEDAFENDFSEGTFSSSSFEAPEESEPLFVNPFLSENLEATPPVLSSQESTVLLSDPVKNGGGLQTLSQENTTASFVNPAEEDTLWHLVAPGFDDPAFDAPGFAGSTQQEPVSASSQHEQLASEPIVSEVYQPTSSYWEDVVAPEQLKYSEADTEGHLTADTEILPRFDSSSEFAQFLDAPDGAPSPSLDQAETLLFGNKPEEAASTGVTADDIFNQVVQWPDDEEFEPFPDAASESSESGFTVPVVPIESGGVAGSVTVAAVASNLIRFPGTPETESSDLMIPSKEEPQKLISGGTANSVSSQVKKKESSEVSSHPPVEMDRWELEDLHILKTLQLGLDKWLYLVEMEGIYALMGKVNQQVALVKFFKLNPMNFRPVFTATKAGHAAGKEIYHAHLGQWEGVISISKEEMHLHTELTPAL